MYSSSSNITIDAFDVKIVHLYTTDMQLCAGREINSADGTTI